MGDFIAVVLNPVKKSFHLNNQGQCGINDIERYSLHYLQLFLFSSPSASIRRCAHRTSSATHRNPRTPPTNTFMVPPGAINPVCPKTVIVSIACSRKKMVLSHMSQRGMIGVIHENQEPPLLDALNYPDGNYKNKDVGVAPVRLQFTV